MNDLSNQSNELVVEDPVTVWVILRPYRWILYSLLVILIMSIAFLFISKNSSISRLKLAPQHLLTSVHLLLVLWA